MISISSNHDFMNLEEKIRRFFEMAGMKTLNLAERWEGIPGAPVFTVNGIYTQRGWTDWTEGFQYGNAILIYEATRDPRLLDYARKKTREKMAIHVSHMGVHDHGFNIMSTYGNLLRLARTGLIDADTWEKEYYLLAIKLSGAVQARRWTSLHEKLGYIYSFNGPHSLFADTIRSLRVLGASHMAGHYLKTEQDETVNLLERLLAHAETTARYIVFEGKGRDRWDVRGRVAHEAIFNPLNGSYRCPSSQQGYSAFTTWTRALAWIILGFAEELEFISMLDDEAIQSLELPFAKTKAEVIERFTEVSRACADYFIEYTAPNGIPYWDTGAPNLHKLGDYLMKNPDPYNPWEPVDSSAAAIAAQGLLRLGLFLKERQIPDTVKYLGCAITVSQTLFSDEYISLHEKHEGLLLHAVYHVPNNWDNPSSKSSLPAGESCMWGDYHMLELARCIQQINSGLKQPSFFDGILEAD